MIGRAARLAAAAAALFLAVAQARTWRAEQCYEAGLSAVDPRTGEPASDEPARDVPGRLEAYDAAGRTDPGQPLYALRAGQIVVLRAMRRPPPPDRAAVAAAAAGRLERALALQPLESRAHDALSQAALVRGDLEGSVRHTRLALLTGPRRLSGVEQCSRRLAWIWRRTLDPDVLALGLRAARIGYEFADGRAEDLPPLRAVPGVEPMAGLVADSGGPSLDDVRLAIRGRDELRETAARLLEAVRPADAAAIRAEAEPR